MTKTLLRPLTQWVEFETIRELCGPGVGAVRITGCVSSQKTHLTMGLGDDKRAVVIAVSREDEARIIAQEIEALGGEAHVFPEIQYLYNRADARSLEIEQARAVVLNMAAEPADRSGPVFFVMTMTALMEAVPEPSLFKKHRICLDTRSVSAAASHERCTPSMEDLTDQLFRAGYRRAPLVEAVGEYAVRGGIADVWPLGAEGPCRIEWWGDEIDTIRNFDPQSQRSTDTITELEIDPILGGSAASASFLDYLDPARDMVVLDEPTRLTEDAGRVLKEYELTVFDDEKGQDRTELFTPGQVISACLQYPLIALSGLARSTQGLRQAGSFAVEARAVSSYNKSFEMLITDLKRLAKENTRTVLIASSEARAGHLAADLREYGLAAYYDPSDEREVEPGEVFVTTGYIHNGYAYPLLGWEIIAESDIFGHRTPKKRPKRKGPVLDINDLKSGDYVVHENHGLGIYRGIERMEEDGIVKEVIKISYADKANLYIPATRLDVIRKYSGGEGKRPRLNKLGSNEWTATKRRVQKAVEEIAEDLVQLYADRQALTGFAFSPDSPWQREFEGFFPYEETEDQLNAICDVKRDMESNQIMDRLICGDVGYGKTEVALRAAFKAVQDSKQVAVLVPTTVLAQQHYNTFRQRFSHFPVSVALLCRFTPPSEQKKILRQLASGQLDLVIGTHRLLSKDVAFKDLGLLVVDEEQRFGVQAKERIKKWRMEVDVLTMTATPIPRTLHMSLVGIRDMSVLEEAPAGRSPVQTYVMEYDEELICEAMKRELTRGGQVYYVHNRARDLADIAGKIRLMMPEANVAFAHGKMTENKLEQLMVDFVEGQIDILVTTTIIETGLDIPNVNTLIVREADRFGLSQLYQLRGRVGRSGRSAYAFLTYRRDKEMSEEADKRLTAIRQFTELGSGIHIAMRDLQIRGAGNMLGEAQSGHMAAVGYDLYCQMLAGAVKRLKGEDKTEEFTTTIDVEADALIPASYIPDESQRLDVYRRIAALASEEETEDLLDELIDRYGEPPAVSQPLFEVASLRILAHEADVVSVEQKPHELRFVMHRTARSDPRKIPEMLAPYRGDLSFKTEDPPYFLYFKKRGPVTDKKESVLALVRRILTDIRNLR